MNYTQLSLDLPVPTGEPAPDLTRTYLAFGLSYDEELAARAFEQRYGAPPEYIFEDRLLLKVGPIPIREEKT